MKRPRLRKSAPGASKTEPAGSQNGLRQASGRSWAAVRRQMAGQTAPEALLGGSWGGVGGSGAALGGCKKAPQVTGRLQRRAPGSHLGVFWMVRREEQDQKQQKL